ncbi:MAG TPA: hypothetical protein VMK12_07165 [Anaeromyxobacteraceae bacterium]|nr:hypothetical protein [Anaeromyxobacteraceae bacterium]
MSQALLPEQRAQLEGLLVAGEGERQTHLDRLRRSPTRSNAAGLASALDQLRRSSACRTIAAALLAFAPRMDRVRRPPRHARRVRRGRFRQGRAQGAQGAGCRRSRNSTALR